MQGASRQSGIKASRHRGIEAKSRLRSIVQRIAYTVRATFPSRALADEYVAWLDDGHIDQVIAGGAHSAMVIRLEGAPPERIEVRYVFSTRESFDRYIEHHAPALRADGLKRFGPEMGITFDRSTGVIL